MKKKSSFFFIICLLFALLATNVSFADAAGSDLSAVLNVNGQRINTEVTPVIKSGRTLVPLRGVFEKLGAEVKWVGGYEQKVEIKYKNTTISVFINQKTAYVGGVKKSLDVSPYLINGRTMIPVRFIAENLGMNVQWYGPASLVTVTDPAYYGNSGSKTVLGFTTNDYIGDNYSYNSLLKCYDNLDSVATFSYHFDTAGNLKLEGQSQQSTVTFVNSNDIKPLVLIHNLINGGFDKDLAHAVLSSAAKRTKVIDNLLYVMATEEYSGVNIDIENIYANDMQYYTSFIKELKSTLSSYGYLTTVSIPAKTSDNIGGSWSGGYDYAQIGKYADQVLLMTYDEHYLDGPAGPIASLPWVKSVLTYATGKIPSNKILLGIPGYGYDWSNSGNKVVTYKGVENVLATNATVKASWDDTAKSPFYTYTSSGVSHVVWYENAKSIGYKLDLVNQYKLGGVGLWKLGYDSDSFWSTINQKLG